MGLVGSELEIREQWLKKSFKDWVRESEKSIRQKIKKRELEVSIPLDLKQDRSLEIN